MMAARRFGSCLYFLQVASGKWRVESSSGSHKFLDRLCLFFLMVLLISKGQDDVSKMRIVMDQSFGL